MPLNLTPENEEPDSDKLKVILDAPTPKPEEDGDYDHVVADDVRSDTSGLPLFRPEEEQG